MRKITLHGCWIGSRHHGPGSEVEVPEELLAADPAAFVDPAAYVPPGTEERKAAEERAAAAEKAGAKWLAEATAKAVADQRAREQAALEAEIARQEKITAALRQKQQGQRRA